MNKVSIVDLKRNLSECLDTAESGEDVIITRHNRPIARLVSMALQNVHRGPRFGRGSIVPLMKRGSGGSYLDLLSEDRSDNR